MGAAGTPPEADQSQEAARWFQQARADLVAARDNIASGHYDWACYMAEQAAEKAVKTLYIFRDLPFRRTHSIVDLILGNAAQRITGVRELTDLVGAAEGLDDVMSSSRYPDAVPFGEVPVQYYGELQAEECIEWAQQIINAVLNLLPTI